MKELDINYGASKKVRYSNIILPACYVPYALYIIIKNYVAGDYNFLFYAGIIILILAIIVILRNTIWMPPSILKINKENIIANIPNHKKQTIEWTSISRVNIGPGYLVFLLNGGQKQIGIRLSELKYQDVVTVKSKIIELCEFKNIPYNND